MFSYFRRSVRTNSKHRSRSFRDRRQFERLEDRRLLAIVLSESFDNPAPPDGRVLYAADIIYDAIAGPETGGTSSGNLLENGFIRQSYFDLILNDHSGSGFFLQHRTGGPNPLVGKFWGTVAPVPVEPNTDYEFSFYLTNENTINNAIVQPTINGEAIGSPVTAIGTFVTNGWQKFTVSWNSGDATSADLALRNLQPHPDGTGNDFAVDDISLVGPDQHVMAVDDSYQGDEDRTLTVSANEGVLANDSGPPNSTLTASLVNDPTHGTVDLNADGSFTYTPAHDFFGVDTFSYTASDGQSVSEEATVTITVNSVLDVTIDVKPGSDPNSINVNSNGTIAVAILTTDTFDATAVDAATVVFADASATQWALEDVDGDGDSDLILHFRTQETNLRTIYEQLVTEDINEDGILDSNHQQASVSLTGLTTTDELFDGADDVDLFLAGRALRQLLDELAAAGAI